MNAARAAMNEVSSRNPADTARKSTPARATYIVVRETTGLATTGAGCGPTGSYISATAVGRGAPPRVAGEGAAGTGSVREGVLALGLSDHVACCGRGLGRRDGHARRGQAGGSPGVDVRDEILCELL